VGVGLALAMAAAAIPPAVLQPAPAAAQGAAGPSAPPGTTGRITVPERSFAPLRPEPGDIWSDVRGWGGAGGRMPAAPAPGGGAAARPSAPQSRGAVDQSRGAVDRTGQARRPPATGRTGQAGERGARSPR
jgi:hypothetical protein